MEETKQRVAEAEAKLDAMSTELKRVAGDIEELLTIARNFKLVLSWLYRFGEALRWVASILAPVLAAWYAWRNRSGGS